MRDRRINNLLTDFFGSSCGSRVSTQVISCALREALYVLDGLLTHDSVLEPTFHSTDTHGYTDHLFGMCYLLGFSFQPRLADLPGQRLYKIAKTDSYGDLDVLFSGAIDVDLLIVNYFLTWMTIIF